LGGVDIPNLLFLLVCAAVALLGVLLGAVLLGIAPMPKFIRYLLMLGFAFGLIMATIGLCAGAGELEPGFAATLFDRDVYATFFTVCVVCASLAALLYTAVLAGFRAPGSNRTRPLRVTATALLCLFAPAWFWLMTWLHGIDEKIALHHHHYTLLPLIMAMPVFLIFTSGERPVFSMRQLQNVPRGIGRFFAWLFGNGQISGMVWCLLLFWPAFFFAVSVECPCTQCRSSRSGPGVDIFLLTVCAYVMTIALGWRYFFKKRVGNSLLWFIILACLVFVSAALQALVVADILPKSIPGNPFASDPDVLLLPWLYRWNAALLFAFVPLAVRDFFQFKKH